MQLWVPKPNFRYTDTKILKDLYKLVKYIVDLLPGENKSNICDE